MAFWTTASPNRIVTTTVLTAYAVLPVAFGAVVLFEHSFDRQVATILLEAVTWGMHLAFAALLALAFRRIGSGAWLIVLLTSPMMLLTLVHLLAMHCYWPGAMCYI